MKIGIDARFMGPVGKGLGRYVEKLVKHLGLELTPHDYYILLRDDMWSEWQPPNERWHKIRAPWRWYSLSEQVQLPRLLNDLKLDLVHFPHFNVPIMYFRPFVVTIHDLILSQFPTERASTLEPIYFWLKHRAYQFVIRSAVKRAKIIISVSQYSADQIVNKFNVAPEKIMVTYEAVDLKRPVAANEINVARRRYGLNQPYLLYVGNAYPHKNIERLLEAFANIRKRGCKIQLALVGKMDYFYQRVQKYALAVGLDINQEVRFTGFVSDIDLQSLYAGAHAYIFPSKAEGFGLPPLEAMQYGIPVASSSASCLPEVLGQAAVFFDPENVNDMVQKIENVVNNQELRFKLKNYGPEYVKKYSWTKMAKQTLEVYESVLQS
ncbi:glycosyltransferase family 4 protein [Patescibacteria group bacterium]